MSRKSLILNLLVLILLSACAPAGQPTDLAYPEPGSLDQPVTGPSTQEPYPAPWEPQAGDEKLVRGEVFVDNAEIVTLESYPPQYMLHLTGSLPTPCNHLRALVKKPDAENNIQVEVYSLADPNEICIQMMQPFEENIPLGSYTGDSYTVLVNDKEVGEIQP